MTGTPDGQLGTEWRGPNLLAANVQTLHPGTNASGPQLVTSWRGVHVRVIPSQGQANVILNWYSDTGEGTTLGSDNWHVNASCGLSVMVPAKGPVCDLNISVGGVVNLIASTQLTPTNAAANSIAYLDTGNSLNTGTLSVPASGTSDAFLPLVHGGTGWLSYVPSDATGKLTLILAVYNADGSFNFQLANFGQPTIPVNQAVGLTDDICGVHVINTDGTSAHSYAARLLAGK